MKARLIILMSVCFVLSVYGRGKTIQGTAFIGKDYKLQFPSTWQINDKGFMGSDVIALSPLENAKDKIRENVCVVLENIPASMTDTKYLELTLMNLNKMFGGFSDKKFVKLKVGKHQGYHLHYSIKVGINEMDNDVYIVRQGQAVYVITCSHAKGKRDSFKSAMDSIIKTFTIK